MNAIYTGPRLPKRYSELDTLYSAFTFFIGLDSAPCCVSFNDISFTVTPEYVKVLKASELSVKPDPPEEAVKTMKGRKTPLVIALVCKEGTLAFTYYPDHTKLAQTTESLHIIYPSYTVILHKMRTQ